MKTIYIFITFLFLSTTSSYAQLEGLLGDIIEEVQEKVVDAQKNGENEANTTAATKKFKEDLKGILSFINGINGLDKYSKELKCIYLILKLASLDQLMGARAQNAALCKEQYDLYGMQLMVKASYTGIGYCYDSLSEIIENYEWHTTYNPGTETLEMKELLDEYEAISSIAMKCLGGGLISGDPESCSSFKGASKLEIDFIMTVGAAIAALDSAGPNLFGSDEEGSIVRRRYILQLLKYLVQENNPVAALGKSIEIGGKMSALPCK